MSLDNKEISSETLSQYIISKNILDKSTMNQALTTYNKKSGAKISFSQFLVDKKYVHESTMKNILDDLSGANKKTTTKKEEKKEFLDEDVAELKAQIQEQLKGKEGALKEILEPEKQDVDRFFSSSGLDWQGRRMTKEDQESLITKAATIKTNDEVSNTNGVFVLNWMSDLLEP
ncbi:MAG: hypothetical protein U0457_10235 [Candidatus Sericytochromatia bacterium]